MTESAKVWKLAERAYSKYAWEELRRGQKDALYLAVSYLTGVGMQPPEVTEGIPARLLELLKEEVTL